MLFCGNYSIFSQRQGLSDSAKSHLFDLLAYFGNVDREATPAEVNLTSSLEQAVKMDPLQSVVENIDTFKQDEQPERNKGWSFSNYAELQSYVFSSAYCF